MKLSLPNVWKQERFHFTKMLRDVFFPSLRPPNQHLIESTTFLQEVSVLRKSPFLSIKVFLLRISKQCANPWGQPSAGDNKVGTAEACVVANPCPRAVPRAGEGRVRPALLALESPVQQPAAPRAASGCTAERDALPAAGNYSPLDWTRQVLP